MTNGHVLIVFLALMLGIVLLEILISDDDPKGR